MRRSIAHDWMILAALAGSACTHHRAGPLTLLPNADLALARPCADEPAIYVHTEIAAQDCVLVPYAVIFGSCAPSEDGRRKAWANALWHEDAGEPDAIGWESWRENAGTVTSYTQVYGGVGFGRSQQVVVDGYGMTLYRLATATTGIKANKDAMVIKLTAPGPRSAGLLEGDTVLLVNGHSLGENLKAMSPGFLVDLLKLQPGDSVRAVWIRPGEGRMEGSWPAAPNPAFQPSGAPLARRSEIKKPYRPKDRHPYADPVSDG